MFTLNRVLRAKAATGRVVTAGRMAELVAKERGWKISISRAREALPDDPYLVSTQAMRQLFRGDDTMTPPSIRAASARWTSITQARERDDVVHACTDVLRSAEDDIRAIRMGRDNPSPRAIGAARGLAVLRDLPSDRAHVLGATSAGIFPALWPLPHALGDLSDLSIAVFLASVTREDSRATAGHLIDHLLRVEELCRAANITLGGAPTWWERSALVCNAVFATDATRTARDLPREARTLLLRHALAVGFTATPITYLVATQKLFADARQPFLEAEDAAGDSCINRIRGERLLAAATRDLWLTGGDGALALITEALRAFTMADDTARANTALLDCGLALERIVTAALTADDDARIAHALRAATRVTQIADHFATSTQLTTTALVLHARVVQQKSRMEHEAEKRFDLLHDAAHQFRRLGRWDDFFDTMAMQQRADLAALRNGGHAGARWRVETPLDYSAWQAMDDAAAISYGETLTRNGTLHLQATAHDDPTAVVRDAIFTLLCRSQFDEAIALLEHTATANPDFAAHDHTRLAAERVARKASQDRLADWIGNAFDHREHITAPPFHPVSAFLRRLYTDAILEMITLRHFLAAAALVRAIAEECSKRVEK